MIGSMEVGWCSVCKVVVCIWFLLWLKDLKMWICLFSVGIGIVSFCRLISISLFGDIGC